MSGEGKTGMHEHGAEAGRQGRRLRGGAGLLRTEARNASKNNRKRRSAICPARRQGRLGGALWNEPERPWDRTESIAVAWMEPAACARRAGRGDRGEERPLGDGELFQFLRAPEAAERSPERRDAAGQWEAGDLGQRPPIMPLQGAGVCAGFAE